MLKFQTYKKSMYSLVACVELQKNKQKKKNSSDDYNQNLEQMHMDKLTSRQLARIYTMIGLNDRHLL